MSWAFGYFKQWGFDAIVLSSTILVLPFIVQISKRVTLTNVQKKMFVLFPIVWLGVFILSFFPTFWAIGGPPPKRVLNIILLLFLLGWYPSISIITLILIPNQKTNIIIPQYLKVAAKIIFFITLFFSNHLPKARKVSKSLFLAPGERLPSHSLSCNEFGRVSKSRSNCLKCPSIVI